MTIEERRQIRVAKFWKKKHPEYKPNMKNALAMTHVLHVNHLDWTISALDVAYQVLKLQKYKFSKEAE